MFKDFNEYDNKFILLISLFIIFFIFIVTDIFFANTKDYKGTIVDKQYVPTRITTYVTNDVQTNTPVLKTITEKEQFVLMVQTNNNIITINTDIKTFSSKQIGDNINYKTRYGKITNWIYKNEIK